MALKAEIVLMTCQIVVQSVTLLSNGQHCAGPNGVQSIPAPPYYNSLYMIVASQLQPNNCTSIHDGVQLTKSPSQLY